LGKRQEYLQAGIREYWIFERFRRTLTVVSNAPGGATEQVIVEGATYEPPLLPGFVLRLKDLFVVADRWSR
jgi:Uma2 family endonuclease